VKLGERLNAIAALVPEGKPLADIGTDHAYLPVTLLKEGKIPSAIAVEVHEGPYQAAREAIHRSGVQDRISLRFGDGLTPLSPGEAGTVVIAGMGGSTIIDILNGEPEVTASIARLVLQPMLAAAAVRRWLLAHNWHIVDEMLVTDEDRLYEIIAAERGVSPEIEEVLLDIGPVLWSKKPPLLLQHIEQIIAQAAKIVQDMKQSPKAVHTARFDELQKKLLALEEKRRCLLSAG
jgi:tRNA (adenine22-N1)-methyltransferase